MNRLLLLAVICVVFSCQSGLKDSRNHKNLESAFWISDHKKIPASDSLFYLDNPAPIFRKQFKTTDDIESASLIITTAGYYSAFVNGQKVGNDFLSPAWTDFSKRIYFTEYDVTSQLKNGDNCLAVSLGNGFYNPLPLRMWGRRNLRDVLPVGKPAFIAKLVVQYKNEKSIQIVSDESWKYDYGPIIKNNVYLGDVFDARQKIENWNLPGFDDENWKNSCLISAPGGELQKAFFPPIQITDSISPIAVAEPKNSVFVVDMGVNFTGIYKIKLKGNKGDTVVFRFGERIYDDGTLNPMTTVCGQIKGAGVGGPGAPDTAWQTDTYIFGEEQEDWFQPVYTYHTYRYMEIKGLNYKPQVSDIVGLALNSNVAQNNRFSSSSKLINSIQEATERTFLSNLAGVQSDCAAREKFGYGGDLNATNESFIYNFDMKDFYRKTIYDWVDAMNDSVFVDTAPFVGIQYCGISWESAFLITQYYLYLYYNDTEIIEELYDLNQKWMEKVARLHPGKLVESGLSDHESLEPVPVELTGTCHYLHCARIMTEFAQIMNDSESAKKYSKLASELKLILRERFWDNPVDEEINKQTLFASLIYYAIIPDNELQNGIDSLVLALKNGPSQHFNTGIFGTKYILEALSKTGNQDLVFDVVNSTEFPGWGFMIDRGATTIWETWKESDNTYSNCHPMFGSVTEWFYRWLAGIQPDSDFPGFEKFSLTPFAPKDLQNVKSNYHSPFGEIILNWEREGANKINFHVEVPNGSIAVFKPAFYNYKNMEINNIETGETDVVHAPSENTAGIELTAGKYKISGFTQ